MSVLHPVASDELYGLSITTGTEQLLVDHCRLRDEIGAEPEDDDRLIEAIEAATERLEAATGRSFVTKTFTMTLGDWPSGSRTAVYGWSDGSIHLPRWPLVAVSSLSYLDSNEASQTVTATDYEVQTDREPGVLEFQSTFTWPAVYDRRDAVTIVFTAGYGSDPASSPALARMAVRHAAKANFTGCEEHAGAWMRAVNSLRRGWGHA